MSPSVVSTFGIVCAIGGVGRAAVSVAAGMPGACARARPEVAAKAPSAKSRCVGPLAASACSSVGSSGSCPARRRSVALLEVRFHGVGDDAPLMRVDQRGGDLCPVGIHAALPKLLNDAGEPLIVGARLELPSVHVALQLLQLLQEPLDRNRWHRVLLLTVRSGLATQIYRASWDPARGSAVAAPRGLELAPPMGDRCCLVRGGAGEGRREGAVVAILVSVAWCALVAL